MNMKTTTSFDYHDLVNSMTATPARLMSWCNYSQLTQPFSGSIVATMFFRNGIRDWKNSGFDEPGLSSSE